MIARFWFCSYQAAANEGRIRRRRIVLSFSGVVTDWQACEGPDYFKVNVILGSLWVSSGFPSVSPRLCRHGVLRKNHECYLNRDITYFI